MTASFYQDKIIAITGAASGMGRSYATLLAQQGAKLLLSDVDEEGLNETVALASVLTSPENIVTMKMDVSSTEHWQAFKELALSRFGGCHMLINNAGIAHCWWETECAPCTTMVATLRRSRPKIIRGCGFRRGCCYCRCPCTADPAGAELCSFFVWRGL